MIITISGNIGAGKSTIARALAKKLNLKHYSTGDLMREMAKEKGMTPTEFSHYAEKETSFDKELDDKTIELGKTQDNLVIDSRLAFNFIPDSVKIFLEVSLDVAAERIFRQKREEEKENISLEKTKETIPIREESEKKRYKQLYGFDYTDRSNFDLVINTSDMSAEEIVDKVVDFLEKRNI